MSHPLLTTSRLLKGLALVSGMGFLVACGAVITDPSLRHYVPTPGSTVTVPQRIEVPGGQTRIFFQRGEIIKKVTTIDLYKANCNFEINTLTESPRYIEAGVYTVTRTTRQEKQVVMFKPQQFAAIGIGGQLGFGGDGPGMYFEEVRMTLQSEQPSDIRNLACRGVMTDPGRVEPPTLAEIREALGTHATIKVPEEQTN